MRAVSCEYAALLYPAAVGTHLPQATSDANSNLPIFHSIPQHYSEATMLAARALWWVCGISMRDGWQGEEGKVHFAAKELCLARCTYTYTHPTYTMCNSSSIFHHTIHTFPILQCPLYAPGCALNFVWWTNIAKTIVNLFDSWAKVPCFPMKGRCKPHSK